MHKLKSLYLKIPPYLLTVGVLCGILWLTLAPDPTGGAHISLFSGADKVAHFIMFASLAGCLSADLYYRTPHCSGLTATAAGAIVSVSIGCIIEFLQDDMSLGRSFEIADMLADAVGAFSVLVCVVVCKLLK